MMILVFLLNLFICKIVAECDDDEKWITMEIDEVSNMKETIEYSKSVKIINSCSFDINLGFTGGFAGEKKDGKCSDSNKSSDRDRCFHYLENYPKNLGSNKEWYTELYSNDQVVTSGNIWATKPEMYKFSCYQGDCKPWVGPTGPITKAEFTLVNFPGIDYYDISTIEGANIPISMYPTDGIKSSDPFWCEVSGSCEWKYDIGEEYMTYYLVSDASGSKCNNQWDCKSDEVCGSSFSDSYVVGVCGKHVGYSSAHVHCMAGSVGKPFECEKYKDVIGCSGEYSLSGYSQETGPVCGCMDTEDYLKYGMDIVSSHKCINKDDTWMKKSLPFLLHLKRGCSDAYNYAYSDMTSTYVCKEAKDYVIEFCRGDSEENFFL